jgi:hypothetical protein
MGFVCPSFRRFFNITPFFGIVNPFTQVFLPNFFAPQILAAITFEAKLSGEDVKNRKKFF